MQVTIAYAAPALRRFLSRVAGPLFFSLVAALPCGASADYLYTYSSNPFTVQSTIPNFEWQPGAPVPEVLETDALSVLNFYVRSPALLTPGNEITGLSFTTMLKSLSSVSNFSGTPMLPDQTEFCAVTTGGPDNLCEPLSHGVIRAGSVSIGAMDDNGLPTAWSVALHFVPLGANFSGDDFFTSNDHDSVFKDHRFLQVAGDIAGDPGRWSVSVVPEPDTYAMLIGGMAVFGLFARRRSRKNAVT